MESIDAKDAIIQAACLQVSGDLIHASGLHKGINPVKSENIASAIAKLAVNLYVAWKKQNLPA